MTEYAFVRDALAGIAPVPPCPGNSDLRRAFQSAFPGVDAADDDPINYRRAVDAVTFVMLDSSVPGEFYGALAAETGRWLQETLAGIPAKTPVVIALHHPPIALGNPPIDQLGLRDSQEFAEVLKQYPNIVAILVGHTHGATAPFGIDPA